MLHDWEKVKGSPVFKDGFKPMVGHDGEGVNKEKGGKSGEVKEEVKKVGVSEHAQVQMEREAKAAAGIEVAAH